MQGKTSSDCKYLFQPNCAKFLHLSVRTKSFVYLSTAKPRPKQWKPKHFDDLLAGISLEIGCDFFLLMMTHKLSVVSIKQPTLRLWMSMRHLKQCSLYTLLVSLNLVNYAPPPPPPRSTIEEEIVNKVQNSYMLNCSILSL